MRVIKLLALSTSFLLVCSCVTKREGYKTYSHEWAWYCDWCKAAFDGQAVSITAPYVKESGRDALVNPVDWGWGVDKDAEKAVSVLFFPKNKNDGKKITADGYRFCSLRCLNSYMASKDIKEDRRRIIYGE